MAFERMDLVNVFNPYLRTILKVITKGPNDDNSKFAYMELSVNKRRYLRGEPIYCSRREVVSALIVCYFIFRE